MSEHQKATGFLVASETDGQLKLYVPESGFVSETREDAEELLGQTTPESPDEELQVVEVSECGPDGDTGADGHVVLNWRRLPDEPAKVQVHWSPHTIHRLDAVKVEVAQMNSPIDAEFRAEHIDLDDDSTHRYFLGAVSGGGSGDTQDDRPQDEERLATLEASLEDEKSRNPHPATVANVGLDEVPVTTPEEFEDHSDPDPHESPVLTRDDLTGEGDTEDERA